MRQTQRSSVVGRSAIVLSLHYAEHYESLEARGSDFAGDEVAYNSI